MNTKPVKPTCEAIRDRLTLYLLEDLDPRTRDTIARHLASCDTCRAYSATLAPTLDLLRDVLQEVPGAPAALSPEHRQRVIAAFRQRGTGKKPAPAKRKPLLLRFHILEMAAVLIASLMIFGLLMPATFKATDRARWVTCSVVEPEPMEMAIDADYEELYEIEEIMPAPVINDLRTGESPDLGFSRFGGGMATRSSGVAAEPGPPVPSRAPVAVAAPVGGIAERKALEADGREAPASFRRQAPPASPPPAGIASGIAIEAPSKPMSEALPVPVEPTLARPATPASARPAEFDSVAIVKSPVIMRGLLGGRSPAAAGERLKVLADAEDIPVTVVDVPGDRLKRRDSTLEHSTITEDESRRRESGAVGQSRDQIGLDEGAKADEMALSKPAMDSKDHDDEIADPFAPRFKAMGVNPFVAVAEQAFSTFSIDVDTASYTLARNTMLGGHLPPPEAVRTEEFVNFFDYAYDPPAGNTFRVAAEIAPSRFGRGLHLLKLGVKGRRLGREEQRQASLTFLVDSSGSMNQPDRLGLVRTALDLLLDELADTDQVAIIQFDNRARLVLEHTPVAQRAKIRKALGAIQCGGGTNLEAGLLQAYAQAAKAFVSHGENRILLMSDGVVNLGETAADGIVQRIEANRQQGLYLSVFGFGMGIYDDNMLKTLASKGNGAYAFIDSEPEARRVFVDDLSSTLNTIAEDVKIQIEFNPRRVNRYRQLGYESRQLTREQFRDDTVDAGEVGSGQSVTALYEMDLAGANHPVPYPAQARIAPNADNWLAIARVRYRRVDNGRIEEIEQRIHERDVLRAFDAANPRFRLAAGVAAFAEILRGSPFVQGLTFDEVAAVLRPVALELHLDARIRELTQMVETAGGLTR